MLGAHFVRTFCLYYVAVTADIKKAFLTVLVAEEDHDALRFLWVEDTNIQPLRLITLRFVQVVFEVSSNPFLLNDWDEKLSGELLASWMVCCQVWRNHDHIPLCYFNSFTGANVLHLYLDQHQWEGGKIPGPRPLEARPQIGNKWFPISTFDNWLAMHFAWGPDCYSQWFNSGTI